MEKSRDDSEATMETKDERPRIRFMISGDSQRTEVPPRKDRKEREEGRCYCGRPLDRRVKVSDGRPYSCCWNRGKGEGKDCGMFRWGHDC